MAELDLSRRAAHTVELGPLAAVLLLFFDFIGLFYVLSSHTPTS